MISSFLHCHYIRPVYVFAFVSFFNYHRWHQARKEAEIFYGISDPDVESCALGPKKRGRSYQPLRLGEAELPASSRLLDPSPGGGNDGVRVMLPLPGAGFVDIDEPPINT